MRSNGLRKGNVILFNNGPCKVMTFKHITPGKGQAVVQVKFRNLITGTQGETRYGATEDVEMADVYYTKGQYLYSDGEGYHFMDTTSYEQYCLTKDLLDTAVYYLQENMEINITTYEDNPIGVELPPTVVLTIKETEPELRGATASNSPKPAIADTGLQLNVPPFIKQGEKVVVKTEDGSYVSRASAE